MISFFEKFPKIAYDINKSGYSNFETVTNIFFRIGIIKNVLSNTSSFYRYEVQDDDTPEIVAENVYGDPGAYWIILYANDMVDPQFDWPLNHMAFNKYIRGKYGSIANAKTTMHHYEKVVSRHNSLYDVTTETRFVVNYQKIVNVDVPYDYYTGEYISADSTTHTADETDYSADNKNGGLTGALPETQAVIDYNIDETTVREIISRDAISCYDYELARNEEKRNIKVIKSEYYGQIISEFNKLTNNTQSYVRRLI